MADSTFRETQREFEIQNRPYIQISEVIPDSVRGGVGITIQNTGNMPAKVIHGSFNIGFDKSNTILPTTIMLPTERDYNIIIAQNLKVSTGFNLMVNRGGVMKPMEGFNEFIRGEKYMFLKSKFTYLNYTNNIQYVWLVTISIMSKPTASINYIQNEEEPQ